MTQTILDCAMHYSRLGLAGSSTSLSGAESGRDGLFLWPSKLHFPGQAPGWALGAERDLRAPPPNHKMVERIGSGTDPWNIGIVTGAASGIILLDIDPRHGGDELSCRP